MDFIIEGGNLPSLEEVKEILMPKGWNFNKGKVPDSLTVLQTYDDEDTGDGIIIGRLRNGLTLYVKPKDNKEFVAGYSPLNSVCNADDLHLGLIDLGYKIKKI